jgi:YebC/PmpR family DNA-binding regulatory protein
VSTDNKNRTAAEIRSLLTKNGGTIATAGSVTRLFQRKGQIIVLREAAGEDQLMELALEAGAEDFRSDEEGFEILTDPARLEAVHKAVEAGGIKAAGAEVTWLPVSTVPLSDPKAAGETSRLIDLLEEHDDVKDVYSNAEFPA